MNEQLQAQELARWLEQPAGTPPPDGLDPDVVESVYSMRPELAPALKLTADDILADFDLGSVAPPVGAEVGAAPTAGGMPTTQVSSAPTGWRSANRVAGIGVLLATAATLLLIAIPVTEDLAPASMAEPTEVAAARQSADPIASTADEAPKDAPEATIVAGNSAPQAAARNAPIPVEDLTHRLEGDAVADAEDYDKALDIRSEQRMRYGGEDGLIPEAEEALRGQAAQPSDDAIADALLEEPAEAAWGAAAGSGAVATKAAAAEPAAERAYEESGKQSEKKERASKGSRKDAGPAAAPAMEPQQQLALDEAQVSNRSRAVVRDRGDQWRASLDAGTLADVDRALKQARTEAGLGQYAKAADILMPFVTAPSDMGQFIAGEVADYQLRAGNAGAAVSVIQRGLGLSSDNTPYRAHLHYLYGLTLDAQDNKPAAEAQYDDAAEMNDLR